MLRVMLLKKKEKVRRDTSSCHTLFYVICIIRPAKSTRVPLASLFSQCVFFWYNTETFSSHMQSSGFVQDRTGKLREHSTISEAIQTWQDSVLLLLKGASGRGEAKERGS